MPSKTRSFLDKPSRRIDAKPGETEGQYQKRIAPGVKRVRVWEREALKLRAKASARIR